MNQRTQPTHESLQPAVVLARHTEQRPQVGRGRRNETAFATTSQEWCFEWEGAQASKEYSHVFLANFGLRDVGRSPDAVRLLFSARVVLLPADYPGELR